MKGLRLVLVTILALASYGAWAYDFETDSICYNVVDEENLTCEVAPRSIYGNLNPRYYMGDIIIPLIVKNGETDYSVVGIGKQAFTGCYDMTSIRLPEGITYIGESSFFNCSSLQEIMLPESITSIGTNAFYGCTSIQEVTIPSGVLEILSDGFGYCSSLTKVTIVDSDETLSMSKGVNYGSFLNCPIEELYVGRNYTSNSSWDVYSVFNQNSKMTTLVVGEKVTELEDGAFYGCSGLTTVTSLNPKPPVCGNNCFYDVDTENCILYIPYGTYDAYSTAEGWKDFFNIVELTPEGIEGVSADGATVTGYYTIDGKAVEAPQHGVNIVKYTDGSTRKVLVK